MLIGYARVSTTEQTLDLQIDALNRAGVEAIFRDHGLSGNRADRPGLLAALAALDEGDTLIVWRLDRLARSIYDFADLLRAFNKRGIAFRSLCDGIDTGSPMGEAFSVIAAAFAHLERSLIIERTRAGVQAAKERGVKFGRPRALNGEELREALFLIGSGLSVPDAATQLGVGRSTLYRYLSGLPKNRACNCALTVN